MDIESLRPFLALTQELNFTRAAARSYLSQPALSRRIRDLEREVGEELFARDSHTVSLTPAGERFQHYAVQLLGLFDAGLADVRGEARSDTDELRVGLFHPAAGEHTGTVLAEYRRRAPAMRVRVVDVGSLDVATALSGEQVDVTLTWGPAHGSRVTSRSLFDDDRAVAVADGHPLAARSTVTADEVRPFPLARVAAPGWTDYWQDDETHHHVDVGSFEDALLTAASGSVACWTPRSLRRFSRVAGLRYVPVVGAAPVPVTVACRRHEARAAVRSFVHVAEQTCRTPALLPPTSLPSSLPPVRHRSGASSGR